MRLCGLGRVVADKHQDLVNERQLRAPQDPIPHQVRGVPHAHEHNGLPLRAGEAGHAAVSALLAFILAK